MMHKVRIQQISFDLTWRIRHEVMYPNLPFDSIKLDNDKEGTHFGLYIDNKLTAVVSLFHKNDSYQFRKFATIVAAQGKGFGTQLLEHIISYVKNAGGKKLWCNARVSATGFYSKFGFATTRQTSVSNGIDFVIMELQLNN
ncbi:GNAT family N-acetyltransferase [Pedobacter africanus]|uniref:Predicted N-acyltransferase, GNAT family n=1 Tax=Pedobacter africanus TaxID=151894 RepID=A0A1W2AHZ5_9SPHI|nr:GNAT family N-acetyltransferase [Pedobacter africanus]SMC60297.1 Predicted N-acyltransferase, GNAT family [Pedobacter africanus]